MVLNPKMTKNSLNQFAINDIPFCFSKKNIDIFDYKLVQRIESLVIVFLGVSISPFTLINSG